MWIFSSGPTSATIHARLVGTTGWARRKEKKVWVSVDGCVGMGGVGGTRTKKPSERVRHHLLKAFVGHRHAYVSQLGMMRA